jgi:FkbM family methyltransferase
MQADLLQKLQTVEKLANSSKLDRLFAVPFKYILAIGYRGLVYPLLRKGLQQTATTFFGAKIGVELPSGTDIYLTGGKSHDSEIRLAKFIINHLHSGDTFVDIGAHLGYFTLLAAHITGENGKVIAFEAAKNTFALLQKNTAQCANITIVNKAISNTNDNLVFYEFPTLYSEYNSSDITQFENEAWIADYQPKKVEIAATTLDDYLAMAQIQPQLIKIDVEGAELKVFQGLEKFLHSANNCAIVMEYLAPSRYNTGHQQAKDFIEKMGYDCFLIDATGQLFAIDNIDAYFIAQNLDSDNVVFKRR